MSAGEQRERLPRRPARDAPLHDISKRKRLEVEREAPGDRALQAAA